MFGMLTIITNIVLPKANISIDNGDDLIIRDFSYASKQNTK